MILNLNVAKVSLADCARLLAGETKQRFKLPVRTYVRTCRILAACCQAEFIMRQKVPENVMKEL